MKKKNEIKLDDNQKRLIATMKRFLNEYVSRSVFAKSAVYSDVCTDDGEYIFFSMIDYGKFKAKVLYSPMSFLAADYVDVKFIYNDCEYEYGIYDIFNLFDINDFEQYYFENCNTNEEMKLSLNNIVKVIERYISDIEHAANENNFQQLKMNFEQDLTAVNGDDSWKTETDDIMRFDWSQPICTLSADLDAKNLLKKLRKRNSKGELDTIYEKRLLAYLENGNTLELQSSKEKKNFEKQYGKAGFIINFVIVVICFAAAIAVAVVAHNVIYKGAYIPKSVLPIADKPISMNFRRIEMCLFSGFSLSVGIILLVKKAILLKIMPENNQKRAAEKYESEKTEFVGSHKKAAIIGAGIIFIIIAFAASYMAAADDIGFFDGYARFCNERNLMVYTVNYDDAVLYKVKGYMDNSNSVVAYDSHAYALGDKNGHYYELGAISENGTTEEKIQDIIDNYNIEVIEIETTNDI
ncbi:MAG: hypothetical protein NC397_01835 [Clostridium sp.]|nr:hypothetical protein [Clostridium sp.]